MVHAARPSPTRAPFPIALLWLTLLLFAAVPARAADATIHGKSYHSLKRIASVLGMDYNALDSGRKARLTSRWTRMEFEVDKRTISINDTTVHLGDAIARKGSTLYVSQIDYERTIQPILTPQVFSDVPKLHRIFIDPGHGGKDPGAQNRALKLQEKNLTLDLARRLEKILRARGYEVVMSRGDDRFISLDGRSAHANRVNADLFVSLHFNAATATSVRGVETFVFTPRNQPSTARSKPHSSDARSYAANRNDVWNTLVGYYVQKSMHTALRANDRGLKRARFTVLRDLKMPGLLVEGGFVSNSTEGRNIGSSAYRQKMAESIADGIVTYQKTLNRLRGR